MNSFIKKHIDFYRQLNTNAIQSMGLYAGKSGLCILYHVLHRYTGEKVFKGKADLLLDDIGEGIGTVQSLDFRDGLPGIGWAIEWLSQHKYININSDEVLEDLDDEIYRSVMFTMRNEAGVERGATGISLYFLSRFRSRNPKTPRLRSILHQECLVLLTDEIETRLRALAGIMTAGNLTGTIVELSQLTILVSKLVPYSINIATTERILYTALETSKMIWKLLPKKASTEIALHQLLGLALAVKTAGKVLHLASWEKVAQNQIQDLWNTIDGRIMGEALPLYNRLYQQELISNAQLMEVFSSPVSQHITPNISTGLLCAGLLSAGANNDTKPSAYLEECYALG